MAGNSIRFILRKKAKQCPVHLQHALNAALISCLLAVSGEKNLQQPVQLAIPPRYTEMFCLWQAFGNNATINYYSYENQEQYIHGLGCNCHFIEHRLR
jgi:hypothetical protein